MTDLALLENGNGGDLEVKGNDFVKQNSWYNMAYMAMFGGNPGYVTDNLKQKNEQSKDWWGNVLLFGENPTQQINSRTEYVLQNIALNSAGAQTLKNAVESDLEFLKEVGKLTVTITILNDTTVTILAQLLQPTLNSGKISTNFNSIYLSWDATTNTISDFSILDFNPTDFNAS